MTRYEWLDFGEEFENTCQLKLEEEYQKSIEFCEECGKKRKLVIIDGFEFLVCDDCF